MNKTISTLYALTSLVIALTLITCNDLEDVPISDPNSPPEAVFAVTPVTGDINTNFKFDGNLSSDKEDNDLDLQARWDFNGDGKWDSDWAVNKVVYYQFNDSGSFTVIMDIKDSQNATDRSTKEVLVTE